MNIMSNGNEVKLKRKTPGRMLDEFLIGETISYEDAIGVIQILYIHSSKDNWKKIEDMFKFKND